MSCSDYEEQTEVNGSISSNEFGVMTRSGETTWTDCARCLIHTGDSVYAPWRAEATGSIPLEIRQDVKEADGWRILYSSVTIMGYCQGNGSSSTPDYLLFYNKYTGILKGFYYATSVQANNHAFFQLSVPTNYNTKLFNFTDEFGVTCKTLC